MTEAPIVDVSVQDNSVVKGGGVDGAVMVSLFTLKGLVATPQLVRSWNEFTRIFGELVDPTISLGSIETKKMLDNGAPLYVSRAGHYTDPATPSTLTGTKAVAAVGGAATSTYAIGAVATGVGGTFTRTGVDVTAKFPDGSTFTVTGSTGNDGTYTVAGAVFGADTVITVVEEIVDATVDGDMNASDNNVSFEAYAIGTGYNGNIVTVAAPASGTADVFDITVSVPGHDELLETTLDFPKSPVAADINQFNAGSREVKMLVIEGEIALGTSTFAQGDQSYVAIIAADWIGDNNAQTGIYAFNTVTEAIALVIPEVVDNAIDLAVSNYCKANWYRAFVRSPIGLSGSATLDYRNKTGAYAGGTVIDDWRSEMVTGGVEYNDADTSSVDTDTTGLGGVIANYSLKHQAGTPWFSTAGKARGTIFGAKGVVINHGAPALEDTWKSMTGKGINTIVPKKVNGVVRPVYWGNRSLQLAATLLEASNIGDLILYLRRVIIEILEDGMFEPLDPDNWKHLYNKAKSEVLEPAATGRALRGGEGEGYLWQGDQNVNDVADAKINTPAGLDAGKYKAILQVKPIRATEFTALAITINGSDVDISLV